MLGTKYIRYTKYVSVPELSELIACAQFIRYQIKIIAYLKILDKILQLKLQQQSR